MVHIGQRLYEERVKKGLTLEEVAKATRIRPSFLLAIEKSEYSKLPSSAYIVGFVKNYADYLGLPKRESLALLRREFNLGEAREILPKGFATRGDMPMKQFRLGPAFIGGIIFFVALLSFLLFQNRYAFINPPLDISTPHESQVVEKNIMVVGKTDANATVIVNDTVVSVENNGEFQKNITLFPGKSTIRITAQNRFGNKTFVERHVEVKE